MGTAMGNYLSDEQISLLLKPIHPQRVLQLKNMSYVEGYDIRAELNRVFGFGRWSEEILHQELLSETETKTNAGKPAWNVIWQSRVRLSIYVPSGSYLAFYDGSHVGESTHPVKGEAHGVALTASETYALRRAAINLGDQFGLSLYNKGSQEALVRWTLVRPETAPVNTDDVPAISAETEPAEEIKAASASVKRRLAAVKADEVKKTAQELAVDAKSAVTPEALTAIGKRAGELGELQKEITIPAGGTGEGEKLKLREYLYRRLDELALPKSPAGAEGDTGTGGGAQ